MYFSDDCQRPLPRGTALGFGPIHQGIVSYLPSGQQVILNKSMKSKRPVVSPPEEFTGLPVKYVRPVPQTGEERARINQNAWNLVRAGAPWTVFDNCQDFVSLCYDGKPGSKTRSAAVVGIGLVLGLLVLTGGIRQAA
jgi:hypothetical protein